MKAHHTFVGFLVRSLMAVLLGIGALSLPGQAQEDMQFVDNAEFEHPQRPPARFDHDTHNETAGIDDCAECHHLYDEAGKKVEGESSEDQSCSDCHESRDVGPKPKLRKAYHFNCKGCHLSRQKGPIVCGDCHKR